MSLGYISTNSLNSRVSILILDETNILVRILFDILKNVTLDNSPNSRLSTPYLKTISILFGTRYIDILEKEIFYIKMTKNRNKRNSLNTS